MVLRITEINLNQRRIFTGACRDPRGDSHRGERGRFFDRGALAAAKAGVTVFDWHLSPPRFQAPTADDRRFSSRSFTNLSRCRAHRPSLHSHITQVSDIIMSARLSQKKSPYFQKEKEVAPFHGSLPFANKRATPVFAAPLSTYR